MDADLKARVDKHSLDFLRPGEAEARKQFRAMLEHIALCGDCEKVFFESLNGKSMALVVARCIGKIIKDQ